VFPKLKLRDNKASFCFCGSVGCIGELGFTGGMEKEISYAVKVTGMKDSRGDRTM
jgi:hypothetical protein